MNRGKLHCSAVVNTVLYWWLSPARFCYKNFVNILFLNLYNIFKTKHCFLHFLEEKNEIQRGLS